MPTFHIIIRAHLDLQRKPKELPDVIEQRFVDEVEQPQEILARIYTRLKEITDVGGLGARIALHPSVNGRSEKAVFVPLPMVTYIDTEISATNAEMPQADPEVPGEFVDRQGKRVGKQ